MKFEMLLEEALEISSPLIALDLDKTLISNIDHPRASDIVFNATGERVGPAELFTSFQRVCEEHIGLTPLYIKSERMWTFPRPQLFEFIESCKSMANVILLTAASSDWAAINMDNWGIDIDGVYSREDLTQTSVSYGSKPSQAILVDDMPNNFTKEQFLGIYGHGDVIQIQPFDYSKIEEFAADEDLGRVLVTIERKLTTTQKPSTFGCHLTKIVAESILDWPRNTLAPEVWDKVGKTYKLKPELKERISSELAQIPEKCKETIMLIGSICSYNYSDKSDLDIHLIPSTDIEPRELEKWQDCAKELSGDLVGKHPINYYLHDPGDDHYADSIYDIKADKWLKWRPIKKVNLQDYYDKFRDIIDVIDLNRAELYRDVIDLEELRNAYTKASPEVQDQIEREIGNNLEELNDEIDLYIDQFIELKDERSKALHSKEFPDDAMRSSLPKNVTFLLIRRYGYGTLATALKDLKKGKKEIGSPRDLKIIKRAFYEFLERLNSL